MRVVGPESGIVDTVYLLDPSAGTMSELNPRGITKVRGIGEKENMDSLVLDDSVDFCAVVRFDTETDVFSRL